jgi:hypothetical protein
MRVVLLRFIGILPRPRALNGHLSGDALRVLI